MIEQVAPPGIIWLFRETWSERHLFFPSSAHDHSALGIAIQVGIGATEEYNRITCVAQYIVLVVVRTVCWTGSVW